MKKLIPLLLALAMLFAMIACDGGNGNPTASPADNSPAQTTAPSSNMRSGVTTRPRRAM